MQELQQTKSIIRKGKDKEKKGSAPRTVTNVPDRTGELPDITTDVPKEFRKAELACIEKDSDPITGRAVPMSEIVMTKVDGSVKVPEYAVPID
jgi:hypothetical protein